jgi:membrane protein
MAIPGPRALAAALRRRIWTDPASNTSRLERAVVYGGRLIHAVVAELASGAIPLRAMSLVFTSILAFVPLLAVSFSVLKGLGGHTRLEPALQGFLSPLGPRADELAERLVGFVDNVEVGALGAIGVALLLYTAISLVQKVESAFNYTWNVVRRRRLVRQFADYFSVLVMGPVLVFLAWGIAVSVIAATGVDAIADSPGLALLIRIGGVALPYVLVIVALTLLYLLIPNTRVRLGAAVFGATVAGLVWQTLGELFALFAAFSTNLTAIYSGFAIILLFILWLYLSWLVLLLGSTLAFYRQFPLYLAVGVGDSTRRSPAQTEGLVLAVAAAVAREWAAGAEPPDRDALASRLRMPVGAVERALDALTARGLLVPAGREGTGYVPGVPPAQTPVKRLLDAVRHAGAGRLRPRSVNAAHGHVLAQIEQALERSCGGLTWWDLACDEQRAGSREALARSLSEDAVP